MDEVKLTIEEAKRILNKGRSTIYNWMNEGRLKYISTAKGRIIVTTKDEIDKILEYEGQFSNQESIGLIQSSLESTINSNMQSNPKQKFIGDSSHTEQSSIRLFMEQFREMKLELLEYAERAGQVKLLTDNNKFYQDEYFKFKYEYEKLTELNKQLENVNKQQRLKMDHLQEIISEQEKKISEKNRQIELLEEKNNKLSQEIDLKKNKRWWKFQ